MLFHYQANRMSKLKSLWKIPSVSLKTIALGGLLAAIPAISLQAAHPSDIEANTQLSGTKLVISTTGEVKATPDLATITAMTSADSATAATATAENAKKMTNLLASLRESGLSNDDIETRNINISPRYRYDQNKPPQRIGYQARSSIQIRIRDLNRIGAIVDKMVQANVEDLEGPNFSLSNSDQAQDQARVKAIAAAKSRADLYARSLGMRVKRIVLISEGQQNTPSGIRPMMLAVSTRSADAAPATPVISGQQTVSVTIKAVFELE